MADPYGFGSVTGGSSSGGDPYGFGTVVGGGGSSRAAAPKVKASGNIGGIIGRAAHWTAKKTELAGNDLKTIPGGLVQMGAGLAKDTEANFAKAGLKSHVTEAALKEDPSGYGNAEAIGKGIVHSYGTALHHPLRDPFQTITDFAPVVSAVGGVALRGAAAADALSEGGSAVDAAKALARKPEIAPRIIKSGEGEVPLHPSHNPAMRIVQGGYDKVVQKSLDKVEQAATDGTTPGKVTDKIAAHGQRRVGNAMQETARYQERMREAPAAALEGSAKKLGAKIGKGQERVQQAALELTSTNTPPEDAAAYHLGQAAKGVAAKEKLASGAEMSKAEKTDAVKLAGAIDRNRTVAKLYQTVADKGFLTKNADGDVIVNAADHPKLAQTDVALARVQGKGDEALAKYGVRTPEALQTAKDAPAKYRAGAKFEEPTPAKLGVKSQTELKAESRVARIQAVHDRLSAKVADEAAAMARPGVDEVIGNKVVGPGLPQRSAAASARASTEGFTPIENRGAAYRSRPEWVPKPQREEYFQTVRAADEFGTPKAEKDALLAKAGALETLRPTAKAPRTGRVAGPGRVISTPSGPRLEKVGGALSVAKDELASIQARAHGYTDDKGVFHPGREKPTGILGGESARPGRGHVSYASSEKRAPTSPVAGSPGPIVGEAKAPITSHANQGVNIAHGNIPEDVTGQAARHYRSILRFVNTTERRNAAIRTGVNLRRSDRDVLVRVPGEDHAKISQAVEEALGKTKPTVDDLAGLQAALDAYREDLVPGLADKFSADARHPVGTSAAAAAKARGLDAPGGYKWVDKGVLGDMAKPSVQARGSLARAADNINSSVTAATVYFKLGHFPQRALTNATTSIIEGAAGPNQLLKSWDLWHELEPEDRQRALGAAGQHGYSAMPHNDGVGMLSRFIGGKATAGSNWWAKHVDAPFRFASIAYEARKAGFDTPTKFKDLLDKLENPEGLDAAQTAKVEWVAKRANRSGIAYDRLNNFEQRYITRGVWFFPWLKGATVFTGHTLVEHPYKSAVIGNAGVQGRKNQAASLGALPDYEQGLLSLGSGSHPYVSDVSSYMPFSTAGSIADAIGRPGELAGFANPTYGSINQVINGIDQYGEHTNKPISSAIGSLAASTPELQGLTAWVHRKENQSTHMFKTTPASALARAFGGAAVPRRLNKAAANKAAARQKSGN